MAGEVYLLYMLRYDAKLHKQRANHLPYLRRFTSVCMWAVSNAIEPMIDYIIIILNNICVLIATTGRDREISMRIVTSNTSNTE